MDNSEKPVRESDAWAVPATAITDQCICLQETVLRLAPIQSKRVVSPLAGRMRQNPGKKTGIHV
jgi:hypothetical protein